MTVLVRSLGSGERKSCWHAGPAPAAWTCSCSLSLGFLFCGMDLVPVPPLRVLARTEQDRRPGKQSPLCLAQRRSRQVLAAPAVS